VTIADEPDRRTIAKAEVPGLSKTQNPIQIVALIGVSIITVWTLSMVPSWQAPGDPFLLAAVVEAVTCRMPLADALAGIAGDEV
jgi:hypothetical protein